MGEAQRRKKAGLGFNPKKAIKFTAHLKGQVKNSYITVGIANIEVSETMQFHLYQIANKLYAEVFYSELDVDRYGWIGAEINQISKLICKAVLDEQPEAIKFVDYRSLKGKLENKSLLTLLHAKH